MSKDGHSFYLSSLLPLTSEEAKLRFQAIHRIQKPEYLQDWLDRAKNFEKSSKSHRRKK